MTLVFSLSYTFIPPIMLEAYSLDPIYGNAGVVSEFTDKLSLTPTVCRLMQCSTHSRDLMQFADPAQDQVNAIEHISQPVPETFLPNALHLTVYQFHYPDEVTSVAIPPNSSLLSYLQDWTDHHLRPGLSCRGRGQRT